MADNDANETLNKLTWMAQSAVVNTWHQKETAHAALLSQLTDTPARSADPKRLHRFYAQVYSQHGEDGYIAEIFSRIGTRSRTFLEIGIGNGLENTTRFLLEQGWRGIWVEGSEGQAAEAARLFARFIETGALTIVPLLVTAENINEAIAATGFEDEFDLISVDIDYNTSHVWRALSARSRVCCIEYNASIPPSVAAEVRYDPQGVWDGSNYFGAGLRVMEAIGRDKGLSLVGCDLQGVNAYLVRTEETEERFCAPYTAANHYELPRYGLLAHIGHAASPVAREWQVR